MWDKRGRRTGAVSVAPLLLSGCDRGEACLCGSPLHSALLSEQSAAAAAAAAAAAVAATVATTWACEMGYQKSCMLDGAACDACRHAAAAAVALLQATLRSVRSPAARLGISLDCKSACKRARWAPSAVASAGGTRPTCLRPLAGPPWTCSHASALRLLPRARAAAGLGPEACARRAVPAPAPAAARRAPSSRPGSSEHLCALPSWYLGLLS